MFRAFFAHHQESLDSISSRWYNKQVCGRAVWRPVDSLGWVGLHIALAKYTYYLASAM
jgi:hypothetical protein